ncbi:Uncharacterised protein [Pseudomonas aeruginosa]|nr:Uncharacterised protein [Pseudomonas aeruginosa]
MDRRDLAEFIEGRQLCGLVLACRLRDEQEDAGGVRGVCRENPGRPYGLARLESR